MKKCDKYDYLDITNNRYGRLIAVEKVGKSTWLFHCDCGNDVTLKYSRVLCGQQSCGCLRRECAKKFVESHTTHGQSNTKLYRKWQHMISRCYDKSDKQYKRYGGRGIDICGEWLNSFETFSKWAYANGYDSDKDGHYWSIDRVDNNKGYSPDNCRFTTAREQQRNREITTLYVFQGKQYTASEFADIFGIEKSFVYRKVGKGQTLEEILLYWQNAHSIPDGLVDAAEYARLKNTTVTTVNRWIKQGKVKAKKYGRKWYINLTN